MLTLGAFIGSALFYVVMGALLIGAIVAFVIVKKKQNQE
jgi:LPXTG-motif cell wall-anchored protein